MHRNLHLVRTDYVRFFHLYMDVDAQVFNGFAIELLGFTLGVDSKETDDKGWSVPHTGDVGELWPQVMQTLARVRSSYNAEPVLPLTVLQPFARIIMVDVEREQAKQGVRMNMLAGGAFDDEIRAPHLRASNDHTRAVQALCDALDGMDYLAGERAISRAVQ